MGVNAGDDVSEILLLKPDGSLFAAFTVGRYATMYSPIDGTTCIGSGTIKRIEAQLVGANHNVIVVNAFREDNKLVASVMYNGLFFVR